MRAARCLLAAAAARRLAAGVSSRATANRALPTRRLVAQAARGMASWGKGTPVTMPALSPTMAAGKIAKWNKQEGGEDRSTRKLYPNLRISDDWCNQSISMATAYDQCIWFADEIKSGDILAEVETDKVRRKRCWRDNLNF